jgi:hypothetical protein
LKVESLKLKVVDACRISCRRQVGRKVEFTLKISELGLLVGNSKLKGTLPSSVPPVVDPAGM